MYTTSNFESDDNSVRAIFLWSAKSNSTSTNNWKPLFELNFSKNSTKTIRLFPLDFYEVEISSPHLVGGGGVLNKVLYGEAPPRGPTPYPFIYNFGRKGTPFIYLLLEKGTPFTYLFLEVVF